MKKYLIEYYFDHVDIDGEPVRDDLGFLTFFYFNTGIPLLALAFRKASHKQQKANFVRMYEMA